MTAQEFVDKLSEMISDRNKQLFSDAELLFIINMGRREIASTLLLFIETESIAIKQEISDYRLERDLVLLVSAIDSKGCDRPINIGDELDMSLIPTNKSYVENYVAGSLIINIAPNVFRLEQPSYNNADNQLYIDFSYYYVPEDLSLEDDIDMFGILRDILFLYCRKEIASRPLIGTADVDINSRNFFSTMYLEKIEQYKAVHPVSYYKSIYPDRIKSRGLV